MEKLIASLIFLLLTLSVQAQDKIPVLEVSAKNLIDTTVLILDNITSQDNLNANRGALILPGKSVPSKNKAVKSNSYIIRNKKEEMN